MNWLCISLVNVRLCVQPLTIDTEAVEGVKKTSRKSQEGVRCYQQGLQVLAIGSKETSTWRCIVNRQAIVGNKEVLCVVVPDSDVEPSSDLHYHFAWRCLGYARRWCSGMGEEVRRVGLQAGKFVELDHERAGGLGSGDVGQCHERVGSQLLDHVCWTTSGEFRRVVQQAGRFVEVGPRAGRFVEA
ncbi:hypothetical protein DEO72_LG7g2015 [Vigna unguiculata]|uniref:Uncharacterized protein n=1 Tax=Vigna unguiculata TaxID=3917 RepID=A0A4D6MLT0_VIGUN|nr:hypothetical protein DEO72_LG7g2015 [Vigna unguiculata]